MWDTKDAAPIWGQYSSNFPKVIASYFTTKQFFKNVILELKKCLMYYAFIKIQNLPWRSMVAYIYNVGEKIQY